MRAKLVLFLFFLSAFKSFTQTDTEFWFAAPNVTSGHDGDNLAFNIRFSTFDQPSEVTISIPANPDFEPIVNDLDANETMTVGIDPDDYYDYFANFPPIRELNRGVLIESTNNITAYFEISTPNNPDIYSLKGENALGTEFYVPFQNNWRNGSYNPEPYSSIDIVATEDNTEITVVPTNPVLFHDEEEFTITLDKGQTYSIVPDDHQGDGQLPENRLGGTKVTSNNPIAVTTSDDSVDAYPYAGCKDVVGDQIIPTDIIGTEYIAMKGRLDIPEHFYIIGTQEDTDIYINDEYETTIDEGETFDYEFVESFYHIRTSNPSYVYHVAGFGCEMGGAVLPPINVCTGSDEVSFTRSKGESFFLNILVRDGAEDGFILNGDEDLIDPDDFSPVFGTSDWLVGEFEFGEDVIGVGDPSLIQNTKDVFHLGIINGAGNTGVLYGYFSDFQEMNIGAYVGVGETDIMRGCYGETFELIAEGGTDYRWEPTDYLDDPTSSTPIAYPPHDMEYWVTVSGYCDIVDSSRVTIIVYDPVISRFTIDEAAGCSTFEVEITDHSINVEHYEWWYEENESSNVTDEIHTYTYTNEGTEPEVHELRLVGRDEYRCRNSMSTDIVVFPEIVAEIATEDISGCSPVTVSFEENSRGASNYLWDFGDGNTTTDIEPTHTFHNNGDTDTTYTVVLQTLSEYGCVDYDSIEVHVEPYVEAGFDFDPPAHCNPYEIEITNTSIGYNNTYTWDFDDDEGKYEIKNDTIYTLYNNDPLQPATFDIQLVAVNDYGCSDSLTREAVVYPYLDADFEPLDSISEPLDLEYEGCNPLTINFDNNSTGAEDEDIDEKYHWSFGDGQGSSSATNPVHTFYNPDSNEVEEFEVELTAISEYGCEETHSKTITVYPRLEAGFTIEKSSYCAPHEVTIYNDAVGASENVHWEFSVDGDVIDSYYETEEEFLHIFENNTDEPQNYTITQTVENEQGCLEVKTRELTVYPNIVADFDIEFDDENNCHPLEVDLVNRSEGEDEYLWDFSAGGTSSQENITRTFHNSSNTDTIEYNIKLIVESEYGCKDSITKALTVNPKPKAELNLPVTEGCSPLDVYFEDQSIIEDPAGYEWIFDDGENTTSNTPGITIDHTYNHPTGTDDNDPHEFNPKLIITNEYGCKDTTSKEVFVYPDIEAVFSVPESSGCHPLEITIENDTRGATGSTPYNWDYGDGNTSTNEDSQHTHIFKNFDHELNEKYTLELYALSKYGCEDYHSEDITVHPVPNAHYNVDEHTGCSPHAVEFEDLSVGGDETYNWTFGDGTTSDVQGDVSHEYEQGAGEGEGEFKSELEIINTYGCSDQHQKNITVYPHIEAEFTADMEGCHPLTVNFEDHSDGVDSYQWDFGDGNYSNKPEPENEFFNTSHTETKDYDVELFVSSQYGCESSTSETVTVYPKPKVDFETDITDGCSPLTVIFEDKSAGVDDYNWNFDNGTSETTDSQFEHIFENKGDGPRTFDIHLSGYNQWGCFREASKSVTVYPEVDADFTTTTGDFKGCTPITLNFVNETELANEYKWSFGDGATTTNTNPNHTFYNTGEDDAFYDVELHAKSSYGCEDSLEKEVTVYPQPVADFEATPYEQTFPSTTVNVVNLSTDGDWSYDWNMGDVTRFTTDDDTEFEHTYQWVSGDYATRHFYIDLHVYNDYCYDEISQRVTIQAPHPIVGFSPSKEGCPPLEVQFSNDSKYGIHFHWDFDDGNYSDKENPVHVFEEPGTYKVTLKVTGEEEVDSTHQVITVFEPPIADFRVEPEIVELPFESVQMVNLSSLGNTYEWYFGDGTKSWDYEPEHFYNSEGNYDITLRVGSDTDPQCFDEITKESAVIAEEPCNIVFPNAFSPKEDGPTDGKYKPDDPSNHIFHPLFEGIEEYKLEIYNRWGELIFRTTDINIGWDGYYKGELVKMDVYVWKVNAKCFNGKKIEETGDVTIIR